MPQLSWQMEPLSVDGVDFVPQAPNVLRIKGKMTARQPSPLIQPYLRKLHDAAVQQGMASVNVDVTELSFVNSSAIRLFVDWTMWAKGDGATPRYGLVFRTTGRITWQRMTITALTNLAPGVVRVEEAS
jgi:hypothetical protein